jgi:hypothetical protein
LLEISDGIHRRLPAPAAANDSAPANGGNDLDFVAYRKPRELMLTARDDFAVALYGDALFLERERAHEVGNGQDVVEAMRGAVEDDREHGGNSA